MNASSSPRRLILRGIAVLAVGAALLSPAVAGADDDAVDWQNVRTRLENWINAASTALPAQVGAPAAALVAMPSSLKGGLMMRCHQNLRRIQGELMDHPELDAPRRAELQLLLEKNQHLLDALNGRPQGLEDFLRRHQQQGGGAAGSPTPIMTEDERGVMDDLLGRYRTRLEALQGQASREQKTFAGLRDEATALDKELSEIAGWAKDAAAVRRTPEIMQGACDHLEDAQRRAQAWAVAVLDGETSCNRALDEAEQRAADCRTDADVALIRRRWVEATRAAAQMAKDLEFADQSAEVARRTVKVLADYQDIVKLKQVQEAARAKRTRLTAVSDDIGAKVDAMLDSLDTLEAIQAEAAALREQVRRSRADSVPLFPESKPQWDALEQALEADLSLTAPERSSNRFEWSREVTRAREDLDALLAVQAPSCAADDRTGEIIERAAAAKDAVMLRLAAAKHVLADADRCARGRGAAAPSPTAAAMNGSGGTQ